MEVKVHEIRSMATRLKAYKEQLLARHGENTAKSPPLFLLDCVINNLDFMVEKSKKKRN